jgi:hypothetical protein
MITAEGRGLLAHELTHAVQQSHPPRVTIDSLNPESEEMPIGSEYRTIQQVNNPRTTDIHAPQLAPVIPSSTDSNTSASTMEAEAQQTEQTARTADESNPENVSPVSINAKDIAERVYRMMQMELRIEMDRVGRHQ